MNFLADIASAYQTVCHFVTVALCCAAFLLVLYAAVDTFLIHKAVR